VTVPSLRALASTGVIEVKREWDESAVERDSGKFAPKGGGQEAAKPGPSQERIAATVAAGTRAAQERAKAEAAAKGKGKGKGKGTGKRRRKAVGKGKGKGKGKAAAVADQPMKATSHTVTAGDTLWELAEQYYGDATMWPLIARANKLTTDKIPPGTKLEIPPPAESDASGRARRPVTKPPKPKPPTYNWRTGAWDPPAGAKPPPMTKPSLIIFEDGSARDSSTGDVYPENPYDWAEAQKARGKKGSDMRHGQEHKGLPVSGVNVLDAGEGIVEAIVSVTGVVDSVNDLIIPGAYTKTLTNRVPKGVFNHDWEKPIAKTLSIVELMPGDPRLPSQLRGRPWPAAAGALLVKCQFNMNTPLGRDAFETVRFYGDEQEWSIGYNVPPGGAKNVKGVRHLSELDLFEYSPVLFGAMNMSGTLALKGAAAAEPDDDEDDDNPFDVETPEDRRRDAESKGFCGQHNFLEPEAKAACEATGDCPFGGGSKALLSHAEVLRAARLRLEA
jgi:HK97 family phage prohead protease